MLKATGIEKEKATTTEIKVPRSDDNVEDATDHSGPISAVKDEVPVTPLPLQQLIPMVFVLVNESFCASMLQPFVAFLVAHLRHIPLEDAGYWSGILSGMFMLGQVVSATSWGRFSDKYGRRPPLVTGLFASGLMMLGFGFSSNIWMCATFRFFHGLFNGNILVAKTMMADITDKTNEAKGFAFISLVGAVGFLVGPALGGILYNPTESDTMQWAHFSKTGLFAKYPALLPSLVVFVYTMIGNVVCTFFVQESNPKAQPLPSWLRCLLPCFWVRARPFIPRKPVGHVEVMVEQEEMQAPDADIAAKAPKTHLRNLADLAVGGEDQVALDKLRLTDSERRRGAAAAQRRVNKFSTVKNDEDTLTHPVSTSHNTHTVPHACRHAERDVDNASIASAETLFSQVQPEAGLNLIPEEDLVAISRTRSVREWSSSSSEQEQQHMEEELPTPHHHHHHHQEEGEQPIHYTHFGFKEAFSLPCTRFMLSQYMVLVAADTALKECLPLWVVSSKESGGFKLSQDKVGYILLINCGPMLISNLLFHKACDYFPDRMGLFRLGSCMTGVAAMLLPLGSYWKSVVLGLLTVVVMTSIRQLFCSWLYSLNTMLTARSAPPGHVGSIMGINQSCGAAMRGLVPVLASPLFAWSIGSNGISFVNHTFVFFLSALLFFLSSWRSYKIRTNEHGNLEMVN